MHDIDGLVLIYQDNNNGELFEQYASDLPEVGMLIDDTGEDMELIGYRTE